MIETGSARNWVEDYGQENGNYCNQCVNCGRDFLGHKRRRVCRVCDQSANVYINAAKDAEIERLQTGMAELEKIAAGLHTRVAELEARLNNTCCVWALDSEHAYIDVSDVMESADPEEIIKIEHVVIAKTTYNVFLPEYGDDDIGFDYWEFEGTTREEADGALTAERDRRRKALGEKP